MSKTTTLRPNTKAKRKQSSPYRERAGSDVESDQLSTGEPLLLLFDIETTGLSIYKERITEITAKLIGVAQSKVTRPSYSRLVFTDRPIPSKVQAITGISQGMLRNKCPLEEVFPDFQKWIAGITEDVTRKCNKIHYPVLVAHNGFKYDFPLLFAEVERCGLDTQAFVTQRIHFADTLPHLRKSKQDGHPALIQVEKLGLESLYSNLFKDKIYQAHRATPDVEAMEEIFKDKRMADLLPTLPKRPPEEQIRLWNIQKETRNLLCSLRYRISRAHAKCLASLGHSYEVLCEIRDSCSDNEEFQKTLQQRKVSKKLREKLTSILDQRGRSPHTLEDITNTQ